MNNNYPKALINQEISKKRQKMQQLTVQNINHEDSPENS